jgi:Xaa-Pro aminopeptidase
MTNFSTELMVAASEKDSDLYYASGFLAPDPFVFLRINGRRLLVMSDLEVDRAKQESSVEEVLSLTEWLQRAKKEGHRRPTLLDVMDTVLQSFGIKELTVPAHFSLGYADALRERGYVLSVRKGPFYPQRMFKTSDEIDKIRQTQKFTEEACQKAMDCLAASRIEGDKLVLNGSVLTSEHIKKIINVSLMENDCVAEHTIVACGTQGCDPHNQGSGPLYANQSIIMDIFPRSGRTRYFADMTRTVVKGKASPKIKKIYQAVAEGQNIAFRAIRDGAQAQTIHQDIQAYFRSLGFETGKIDGRMQGFFHGTGHGLGLDVHEAPRISAAQDILREGMVVTVEPGLYYADEGGVRLEDLVWVQKEGMENLTQCPKVLEIP